MVAIAATVDNTETIKATTAIFIDDALFLDDNTLLILSSNFSFLRLRLIASAFMYSIKQLI